jgi:hypothetical protein
MGILATDILIKSMIEAAFHDLRKTPYLLDDVFGGMADDTLTRIDHGYKEVARAKQWFLDNEISVFFPFRVDAPTMPCVTIALTQSMEMQDRAGLADEPGEDFEEQINPRTIDRQIPKVYSNFTPTAYNPSTGRIQMPTGIDDSQLVEGQFVVSVKYNKAYVIKKIYGGGAFDITTGIKDDFSVIFITPSFAVWNVHREMTFLNEAYSIGVHAQSDPVTAIWMRQLLMYVMLRYKEAYLEARGFEISGIQAGEVTLNQSFDMDRIFSCYINLSGQVEANWIKYAAPRFDKVTAKIKIIDGPKTPDAYLAQLEQGWEMEDD